jgi:hypothetical protein
MREDSMKLDSMRMWIRGPVVRARTPVAFSWILIAGLMAFLGWSYFSHPKPGPYGVCYSNKGRNACPPDLSKAGREADLALNAKR